MRLFVALLCANWMLLPVPSLADGWGAASMTRVVDDGPLPGASIRWETVKENQVKKALKECSRQKKPALVYFHQDSCAACTRLWNAIMQSARIAKDAKRFVMIKVVQGDAPPSRKEPNALGTRPDGGYTPRVLFYNASGVFQPKIYNAIGNANFKYFYYTEDQLLESMWQMLPASGIDVTAVHERVAAQETEL